MARTTQLILAAFLAASAVGCDDASSGDGDDDGADGDADADTDGDSDGDTDTDGDTDSDSDADADYPPGPYGFTPSATYEETFGPVAWTGEGDVIPDVCLPNALGEEVCLGGSYHSEAHELLFVDFTTMW